MGGGSQEPKGGVVSADGATPSWNWVEKEKRFGGKHATYPRSDLPAMSASWFYRAALAGPGQHTDPSAQRSWSSSTVSSFRWHHAGNTWKRYGSTTWRWDPGQRGQGEDKVALWEEILPAKSLRAFVAHSGCLPGSRRLNEPFV